MKKILCKIGDFFETLFAMIVALIFGVCVVFLLPLDYIKYKRSLYYKTEHKKYKFYAASGVNFEIYNEIIKNDLPIKFICNPDDDSLERGCFVYNNTLIIPNVFSFEYNTETKKWNYCCEVVEEDDTEKRIIMSLEEYIEIVHESPYAPSFPTVKNQKENQEEAHSRRICVFERASQLELLSENTNTFMWVSSASEKVLSRYGLVEKECKCSDKNFRDMLIFKQNYTFSVTDKNFINALIESKRKYIK